MTASLLETIRQLTSAAYDDGDLLRANPNHAGWDEEDDTDDSEEAEGSDAERDDVEALVAGVEGTKI